jgi:hypothetical protein
VVAFAAAMGTRPTAMVAAATVARRFQEEVLVAERVIG